MILMVAVLSCAVLGLWIPGNNWDVRAAEMVYIDGSDEYNGNASIAPEAELKAVFDKCNNDGADYYVTLNVDVDLTSASFTSGAPLSTFPGNYNIRLK